MKRFTVGLATLLTGAVITACGAPSSTTSPTTGAGTGSTSATTTSATAPSLDEATTEATSTSDSDTSATTEATSTSGMDMATTEATTTSGSDASATTAATSTSGSDTSATTAATSTSGDTSATSAATGNTIVDVAGQQGNFTTLIAALQATGLDDTLSQAGEYTVFAPTDEAFAALPAGTLTALLADPTLLTQILSYHVAQGELLAADVTSATSIPTVEGQAIEVSASGGTVTLNGEATVTSTDIQTSNGVIHVIDQVLLPPGVTLPSGS